MRAVPRANAPLGSTLLCGPDDASDAHPYFKLAQKAWIFAQAVSSVSAEAA